MHAVRLPIFLVPLHLNLQFMTFQCKKGYFWSNYRSGPHLVEQRKRKYQNLDTRALERGVLPCQN